MSLVDGILSGTTTDASSHVASLNSTPDTTVADSASQHSDVSKLDNIVVPFEAIYASPLRFDDEPDDAQQSPRRRRRTRVSAPVKKLSRPSATGRQGRRRTISGDTLVASIQVAADDASPLAATSSSPRRGKQAKPATRALSKQWSPASPKSPPPRRQTRHLARTQPAASTPNAVSTLGRTFSKIGKRTRRAVGRGVSKLLRELRRLQDTDEFCGIETQPILYTTWSNGKYVNPNQTPPSPARKKVKVNRTPEPEPVEPEPVINKTRRAKNYLDKGLYAGQAAPPDLVKGLTPAEKKKLSQLPELTTRTRPNQTMTFPIYTGLRMLIAGRDFKLPFHVCNPLPPGQPKPDEWKRMAKNRLIGDSKDYWRKMPHLSDQSKCVCKPDDGCGESCQNRIMLYECDATNCNIGKELCRNRAFADLSARRAKGGKYRVGVEVIKTSDRGYGVRSNRCFRPHQIIMEYAGEIITEEECERRMKEVYKDNECYYLMSFDQNMIIDATSGSIARFVNHSCNPNCRMVKWIVSGQPHMALFAGDKPIMTGDELTYDYNFDPFSAKNVQACLCGERNCRGVLGPKTREVKAPKVDVKKVIKATVKAGKRKLKELVGDAEAAKGGEAKKRKLQAASAPKASHVGVSLKAANKTAAPSLKATMSTITVKTAKVVSATKRSAAKRPTSLAAVVRAKSTLKTAKQYSKLSQTKLGASASSSLTIIARSDASAASEKVATLESNILTPEQNMTLKKGTPRSTSLSVQGTTKSKRTTPTGGSLPKKAANRAVSDTPSTKVTRPRIRLVYK